MSDPYIFISYASKDDAHMRQIVDTLHDSEISVWVDVEGLRNGDKWLRELEKRIVACAGMLVLMSVSARESEWVEREVLLALDHKKPIFIARFDQVPLPLHLINRQFTAFENDIDQAMVRLLPALRSALRGDNDDDAFTHSVRPNEDNFFDYLQQMPNGDAMAMVARDLYAWARKHADSVVFGGKHTPALHAKLSLPQGEVTVFSVMAYLRNPAVQISLDALSKFAPYDQLPTQQALLQQLSDLLPSATFDAERKKPALPLASALHGAEALEAFKTIVDTLVHSLKNPD